MNGNIAKKILVKFLKENKLMGTTLIYTFAYPIKGVKSNTRIINEVAKKADKEPCQHHLVTMLGHTHEVSKAIIKLKEDYLFDIYLKWTYHVKTNWKEIQEYYKLEQQKMSE